MTGDQNIVDAFYQAYNAHDAAAAAALYAPDCWHEEVAFGKRRAGRDDVASGLDGFFRFMPDAAWRERDRLASGSSVVVFYDMIGHVRPRGAAAAAPVSIALPGVHVFELGPEGIRGTRDYWNADDFKRQSAG